MTAQHTITEDELIELLAAAAPNTLGCEDAMWSYVNADDRQATFNEKALKMGRLIAETAERRRAARITVANHSRPVLARG